MVGIAETIDAGEVRIELLAVELRGGMGRLTLVIRDLEAMARSEESSARFRASPAAPLTPDEFEDWPLPLNPIIHLDHDLGTNYRVWPTSMSGGDSEYHHAISFLPSAPDTATVLTITIERFTTESLFPTRQRRPTSRVIEGPWRVDVPLKTSA